MRKENELKQALVDGQVTLMSNPLSFKEFLTSTIYKDFETTAEFSIIQLRDKLEFDGSNIEFTRGKLAGIRDAIMLFTLLSEGESEQQEIEDVGRS